MGMTYIKIEELNNQVAQVKENSSATSTLFNSVTAGGSNITLPLIDPKSLNVFDEIQIRFIVEFDDGELWTSPLLYNDLLDAYTHGNPYFNLNAVPKVNLNSTTLINLWEADNLLLPQRYAEVDVERSITTKKKILNHIDWMVKQQPVELRPSSDTKTLNDGTEGIGFWQVNTTDSLGSEFYEELKELEKNTQ